MTPVEQAVSGMVGRDAACFVARTLLPASTLDVEEPWSAEMVRPLTERSANIAKLTVPLPPRFREAFRSMIEARSRIGGKRVFARDLHEEAIGSLVNRAERGEKVLFMATPVGVGRITLWMDESLKAKIDSLALTHGVARASVVVTAFHHFLDEAEQSRTADAA
ncbi:hypothetical protein [Roseomonas chloroacetimidivorans]|uniref:hypothetical protein n=1 Tax=Roseomonas chloroacetimidivorans TaxID=1766656 RepID=UPI003C7742D8